MALSSLAPAEKTEHLIYSLLPISLATWCASLLNLSDPIQILTAIVSISSFGTIILYEFTPEQWIVNGILRWRTRNRKSLKEAILIFSLMMQMWNTEPSRITDWNDSFIEKQAKTQVSIAVSGPYIRKRIWRIRASIYLFFSIWFIFSAFWNYLNVLLESEGVLTRLPDYASGVLTFLYQNMTSIIYSVQFLIIIGLLVRQRKLLSNIDQLSRYNQLRRLLSLQRLRRPDYFVESKDQRADDLGRSMLSYLTLTTELDALFISLTNGEWSSFFDGWDRIYHWVHRETVLFSEKYLAYDLMKPFADAFRGLLYQKVGNPVNLSEIVKTAKQKLDWVCYFFKKCEEYKVLRDGAWITRFTKPPIGKDILSLPAFDAQLLTLQSQVCQWSEDQILEPNTLLGVSSGLSTITREGAQAAIMFAVAQLKEVSPHYLQGAEKGLSFLLDEMSPDPLKTKLNPEVITKVILRGFQDEGVGYSVRIVNHHVFKNLKQYCPNSMENEWEKALAHYIRGTEKSNLMLLLEDHGFLDPLAKSLTRIRDALADQRERFKEDKQVLPKFRRYV